MKNISLLLLLLFLFTTETLFWPALGAKQKLLTVTLKNNSMVDVIKLEPEDLEDRDILMRAKELFIKTFLEVYEEYSPEQLYLENKSELRPLIEVAFESEENDFINKKKEALFVVARDVESNKIIGFVSYDNTETSENRTIYIRQLAIDRAYRKQGLGKALVLDMIKIIAQNQPAVVMVCARKINESAISFYHKLNFQDALMKDVHPELPEHKWCGFKLSLNGH